MNIGILLDPQNLRKTLPPGGPGPPGPSTRALFTSETIRSYRSPYACLNCKDMLISARWGVVETGGRTRRRLGRLLLLFPAGPATPLALALALLPLIVLLHIEHADVARDRPDRACREGVGKRFQPRLVPGARLAVLHEEREVAFVVRRPIARFVADGQRLAAEEDPLRQPRPRRTVSMPARGI